MLNLAFAGTLPLQGSEIAVRWDHLYSFILWLSAFFFVLVVGAMIYFIFAYPHQAGRKTKYVKGSHLLEAVWIAVPTVLLLVIFAWGYSVYYSMKQAPSDAYEIRVIGKQWLWTFQYDTGKTTVGEVFVPINRPVKLVMTSDDVLHGFFIPNFRIKQDVVPGMYTTLWFTATVPGKHQVYCTEYCGTSHSAMLAQLIVLDEDQWTTWSRGQELGAIPTAGQDLRQAPVQLSLVAQGKLVHEKKGCTACHSVDGSSKIGPSHKGLFGSRVELADGRFQVADENTIRSHIENPQKDPIKGYSPVMPTFKGLITEAEMNALIAYIKSLK